MQLVTSCSSIYSMLIHAFGSFLTTQNKQIASCRYICSRWMEKMNREIRCVRWLAQSCLRSLWNHSNLVYFAKHWQCRQNHVNNVHFPFLGTVYCIWSSIALMILTLTVLNNTTFTLKCTTIRKQRAITFLHFQSIFDAYLIHGDTVKPI